MKLMQEFLKLHENANRDVVVDLICKACCKAKCAGIPYEQAVGAIAAEFRKLDKREFSSKMSDEALKDMIMAIYDHDKHLSQDQAITNYRDVHFDYQPVREDEGEAAPKRDLKSEAIGLATRWLK